MTNRNRIKLLKAKYIGKSQEVKRLRKMLKLQKEAHQIVLNDYHELVNSLQAELTKTDLELQRVSKKKWYQFINAEL